MKKNLRVIIYNEDFNLSNFSYKTVMGGILSQTLSCKTIEKKKWKLVTECKPNKKHLEAMELGWKIVKYVKSNAIVIANKNQILGVGAGQMSRVDSVKIASFKSRPDAKGTVMASDAFFPFPDGIEAAAEAGVTAIIQSGGSIRDQEVIDAANEHNIAMLFTGVRHFKH